MLNWSINLFRIRGIQLAVHSSFLALLAYVAWEGWKPDPADGSGGGWMGVFWNVVILLSFFTCVVLHELGHSLTAMRFGIGVRRILLMPIGGMAEFESIPRQPSRELLITLAGPAVNFLIAFVLWICVGIPHNWPWGNFDFASDLRGMGQLLMHWNILMGCFNLVPVFPMDGGRIFRALLATKLPYLRATWIAVAVGKTLAAVAAVGALLAPLIHRGWQPHYLIAALFAFIFFAGEMEYRATARREAEDAHWRHVIAQFYARHRPLDEPPILSP